MPGTPVRRILVVDDEPLVCDALKLLLRFEGHEVVTAGSGQEALSLLENDKFDLVITDYEMPGLKGDALACAIKGPSPTQPVILITAYTETLAAAIPLPGVDLVLSKPFELPELRRAIAKVLPSV